MAGEEGLTSTHYHCDDGENPKQNHKEGCCSGRNKGCPQRAGQEGEENEEQKENDEDDIAPLRLPLQALALILILDPLNRLHSINYHIDESAQDGRERQAVMPLIHGRQNQICCRPSDCRTWAQRLAKLSRPQTAVLLAFSSTCVKLQNMQVDLLPYNDHYPTWRLHWRLPKTGQKMKLSTCSKGGYGLMQAEIVSSFSRQHDTRKMTRAAWVYSRRGKATGGPPSQNAPCNFG